MQTQLIISRVDLPRGSVRHGERYPLKVYFESTKTAVVIGDDGQEHKLTTDQYTTWQEQDIKNKLAKAESEQKQQPLAS